MRTFKWNTSKVVIFAYELLLLLLLLHFIKAAGNSLLLATIALCKYLQADMHAYGNKNKNKKKTRIQMHLYICSLTVNLPFEILYVSAHIHTYTIKYIYIYECSFRILYFLALVYIHLCVCVYMFVCVCVCVHTKYIMWVSLVVCSFSLLRASEYYDGPSARMHLPSNASKVYFNKNCAWTKTNNNNTNSNCNMQTAALGNYIFYVFPLYSHSCHFSRVYFSMNVPWMFHDVVVAVVVRRQFFVISLMFVLHQLS